jgi:hypothetical protein
VAPSIIFLYNGNKKCVYIPILIKKFAPMVDCLCSRHAGTVHAPVNFHVATYGTGAGKIARVNMWINNSMAGPVHSHPLDANM